MRLFRWLSTLNSATRNEIDLCVSFLTKLNANTLPLTKLFEITYARSSGPGGQKVNKTSSKAVISMSQETLEKKLAKYLPKMVHEKYLTAESTYKRPRNGGLIIASDTSRSRSRNLDECFSKFLEDLKKLQYTFPKEVDEKTVEKWKMLGEREALQKKKQKILRKAKKENRKKIV